MPFLDFLHRVAARERLSDGEAESAMSLILGGEATTAQIAAFLVGLRTRGETAEELYGFARAMRAKVTKVDGGDPATLIDTCGTGGDGCDTFNISTVVAFVVAGAGVRVAKHGNRSISSKCGSADVLQSLGVNIALTPEQMGASIREVGMGFLFAPALHPAMKHAQPARLELKMRTAFNLLGPLTNPAGASSQLTGAPSVEAAELMATALLRLGLRHGFIVHGSDGLDEVTTTGATHVWEVRDHAVNRYELTPVDFGVRPVSMDALRGDTAELNATIARDVLHGVPGPHRDIVLVNAALALIAAGKASTYPDGMVQAARSIDSRSALDVLNRLVRWTSEAGQSAAS